MNIIWIRRISQVFFTILFLWFCTVATLGAEWHQLRGWPVNWFLQLDPLVGLGTFLTTRTLFAGLAWGVATLVLTLLLGRFFCGWVCPFGALHQFTGYIGHRKKKKAEKLQLNRYRKAQRLKYWLLIFLLCAAGASALDGIRISALGSGDFIAGIVIMMVLAFLATATVRHTTGSAYAFVALYVGVIAVILGMGMLGMGGLFTSSLQTGLLDPIPLLSRSVNLALIPFADKTLQITSPAPRYYDLAWTIGILFLSAVLLNLWIPRFYCRFICPLGALFGIVGQYSVWRIGQKAGNCITCKSCDRNCEGACEPSGRIRTAECVVCLNCFHTCPDNLIDYAVNPSAAGEHASPDLARRELIVAAVSGVALVPVLRFDGNPGPNWNPDLIRPPGALNEASFLFRCIKCGQCMRVCPTNIIQPAGFSTGIEGLWTPRLNFRIGTSGCQLNCIACGNICPTAAIRPLRIEEKLGKKDFADKGPIRLGTAFVDRNRCLPWAMKKPCIVCQENCPVSPKAIYTAVTFAKVRLKESIRVGNAESDQVRIEEAVLPPGKYATGDYFVDTDGSGPAGYRRIIQNGTDSIRIAADQPWNPPPVPGSAVEILVRLQRPHVDPEVCIGCGTCEHECPVSGKRAIRVSAENESRAKEHALLL